MNRLRSILLLTLVLMTLVGLIVAAVHQHDGDPGERCRLCHNLRTLGTPERSATRFTPIVVETLVSAAPQPLPRRDAITSPHHLRGPPAISL